MMAFVNMLQAAQRKHTELKEQLRGFAVLVLDRVPQAGYFLRGYLEAKIWFTLRSTSLDAWPQALINDIGYLRSLAYAACDHLQLLHYLLMLGNLVRLKQFISDLDVEQHLYPCIFRIIYAVEPALLRKFFDIGFAKESDGDHKIFQRAAPVAMGVDSTLSSALVAIARENGWADPVAEKSVRKELAEHEEVGGSVHMQPLVLMEGLDSVYNGLYFAGSATLKTVSSDSTEWQLLAICSVPFRIRAIPSTFTFAALKMAK